MAAEEPAVKAGVAEVQANPPLQAPLSLQQARNLHLAVQGLLKPARARATRRRVLDTIAQMRLLQIDTIHGVARSPYLVLFSRLGDYRNEWLEQLLARGSIFECWAHEACFAPIGDLGVFASSWVMLPP